MWGRDNEESELSQYLPDAQRVDEVAWELQSDSEKLRQVVWGGGNEEIQSVGELSQDLTDAQRVDEVACEMNSDSDKLRQVVWGGGNEEIHSVGELSQECERLPDAQRVAEVACADCRRTWRRVKQIRMDNVVRRGLAEEVGPSLAETELDNNFPANLQEILAEKDKTTRKKSLSKNKIKELRIKTSEILPRIDEMWWWWLVALTPCYNALEDLLWSDADVHFYPVF